ncbi:hypothetical protein [Thermomonospora umbrina]|uniref:hypothetical protein n=1 Tax=Thermomonospora umbrina TaxID=111806 RepID=UPI000E237DBD|nr:hypothetical protein [Thermomonospora umbrina]
MREGLCRCVAVIGGGLPLASAVTLAVLGRVQYESDMLSERSLLFVACTPAREAPAISWHEPLP